MRVPRARLPLLLLALPLLGGCTYSVRIRNDNDQALTARLVQTDPLMKDWVLAESRVDPGETVQLGPARTMAGSTLVEIDATHGQRLDRIRRAVLPGEHAFRIGLDATTEQPALMLRSAHWGELTP
jgi:hypothetical protein